MFIFVQPGSFSNSFKPVCTPFNGINEFINNVLNFVAWKLFYKEQWVCHVEKFLYRSSQEYQ